MEFMQILWDSLKSISILTKTPSSNKKVTWKKSRKLYTPNEAMMILRWKEKGIEKSYHNTKGISSKTIRHYWIERFYGDLKKITPRNHLI